MEGSEQQSTGAQTPPAPESEGGMPLGAGTPAESEQPQDGREHESENEGRDEGEGQDRDPRHPEPDQSPIATDRQKAIQGDPGFNPQQPQSVASDVDRPVATSPPPPESQSGIAPDSV